MKILFILPYSPVPPTFGGATRVCYMMKNASRHHELSILTWGDNNDERDLRSYFGENVHIHLVPEHWPRKFRRMGQLVSLFTPRSFFSMLVESTAMKQELHRLLAKNSYDIIQTEFTHTAAYDLPSGAYRIIDSHNVEYDNFRRIYEKERSPLRKLHYYYEFKKFKKEEREACLRYQSVFMTSERDKEILDRDVPEIPKYVVPNGVDSTYFTPSEESPEPYSLVFTGAMSYVPNNDGALYFLDAIFPLILKQVPRVKVYIVGGTPTKKLLHHSSDNVIVTGFVDDVRPYIRRSNVYVVPLRMGSGTRLKVLEAMAMKIPIVTTSIGCEGIDVHNGESVLIADDPQSFADSVIRLMNDQSLRRKLTENGYETVTAQYTWSVIGEQVEALYKAFRPDRAQVKPEEVQV